MRTFSRIIGVQGVSNFGLVYPGVYRSACPEGEGYRSLRDMGVRSIVNLQQKSFKDELEPFGLMEYHYPNLELQEISVEELLEITNILSGRKSLGAFDIHCRAGQNRTGVISAAYRMRFCGWDFATAMEEAHAYGFLPELIAMSRSVENFWAHLQGEAVSGN